MYLFDYIANLLGRESTASVISASDIQRPIADIVVATDANSLDITSITDVRQLSDLLNGKSPMQVTYTLDSDPKLDPLFDNTPKLWGEKTTVVRFYNEDDYTQFIASNPERLQHNAYIDGQGQLVIDRPLSTGFALSDEPLGLFNPPIVLAGDRQEAIAFFQKQGLSGDQAHKAWDGLVSKREDSLNRAATQFIEKGPIMCALECSAADMEMVENTKKVDTAAIRPTGSIALG